VKKPETIIVVSDLEDLPSSAGRLVTADDFLAGVEEETRREATVVNLCRSWRYLSKGYYVSLLADARGQTVLPTVDTVEGVLNPHAVFRALQEAGVKTIDVDQMSGRRRSLPDTIVVTDDIGVPSKKRRGGTDLPLVRQIVNDMVTYRPAEDAEVGEAFVFLGECADKRFARIAAQVYRVWPMPILLVRLLREDDVWKVVQLVPLKVHKLGHEHRAALVEALDRPPGKLLPKREPDDDRPTISIGLLYDENDRHRPSTPETIDRLVKIGVKKGIHVHRIETSEIARLGDYDALFIRALTGLETPAFRFAVRAEALGMPVIDETRSIIRCGNKVYLYELLSRAGLPMPPTMIATRQTRYEDLAAALRLPFIVKLPDGSFSSAVFKVKGRDDYEARAADLFKESPLLICQAYMPTDFDWRVTTLDGKPLFVCKYHMAAGHWQIRDVGPRGARNGRVEAIPRDEAPREVVRLGCRAAKLIGEGLHGVDIKETPQGPVVIEVNDNPNVDVGYDDAADGDLIYEEILDAFVKRIEEARRKATAAAPAPAGAAKDKNGQSGREPRDDPASGPLRKPIGKVPTRSAGESYKAYEVCGLELEYVLVDRDLNAVPLAESCLAALAGRPASDATLGVVGFSNELFQHVLELKTEVPLKSLAQTEEVLVEGVRRAASLLAERFDSRLLPTGMHPWLDPRKAKMWERSNNRIYNTYARLFDTTTHGWANVQATHVNLPLGTDKEAVAMMNAAALLVPYLPAIGASTPIFEGDVQPAVDNRLQFIIEHQTKIPESCGLIVPEFVASLPQYKRDVLGPMYRAVEKLEGGKALRHEFLNARGAVFKFSRESMEVRILDTQECVKMDVAIAVFVRWTLKALAEALIAARLVTPDHRLLVEDFRAVVKEGTRARVFAPHLLSPDERDDEGKVEVRRVLDELIAMARKKAPQREEPYLDLVAGIVRQGSLSERMKAALEPYGGDYDTFTEAARRLYIQLSECLTENRPWAGRGL
jgi:glutathione synthase/RimK-type ligase-like ATP-grasp enzyme/gamma-glutamyl:cysteine ligase YbdK (ATP-grasp superfamily)